MKKNLPRSIWRPGECHGFNKNAGPYCSFFRLWNIVIQVIRNWRILLIPASIRSTGNFHQATNTRSWFCTDLTREHKNGTISIRFQDTPMLQNGYRAYHPKKKELMKALMCGIIWINGICNGWNQIREIQRRLLRKHWINQCFLR